MNVLGLFRRVIGSLSARLPTPTPESTALVEPTDAPMEVVKEPLPVVLMADGTVWDLNDKGEG